MKKIANLFTRMNLYQIFAIVFVALGGLFTFIGNSVKNSESGEKIDKMQKTLDEINGKPTLSTSDSAKIQEIVNDPIYQEWVHKLDIPSTKLEMRGIEANKNTEKIEVAKEYRPYYVSCLSILENYLKALADSKKEYNITYDIHDIPTDFPTGIFPSHPKFCTVFFDKKIKWYIGFGIFGNNIPSLRIEILEGENDLGSIELIFDAPSEKNSIKLITRFTDHIYLNNVPQSMPLKKSEPFFKQFWEQMLREEIAKIY